MQSGGDSFCQTWSLMFLSEASKYGNNFEFLETWKQWSLTEKEINITKYIVGILDGNTDTIDAEANFELQNLYDFAGFEVADTLKTHISSLNADQRGPYSGASKKRKRSSIH